VYFKKTTKKKVAQGLIKALAVTHTGVLVQLCYPDSASLLLQIMFCATADSSLL